MGAADLQDINGSKLPMKRSPSPSPPSSIGKRRCERVRMGRISGRISWSRIEKRVRMLKRLVPMRDHSGAGLEVLFMDTADYILSLEARVRAMQMMVDELAAGSN
ncbi:hypothetical protein SAY86_015513 [Trapa natans]|uniref:Uncharacterized protein n=1 Tax=Trapa natans TaxID=22666 RepID=A0AAN7QYK6_TRANT|nr:hypothetical protein SAY86_015513 [Trapa natans]